MIHLHLRETPWFVCTLVDYSSIVAYYQTTARIECLLVQCHTQIICKSSGRTLVHCHYHLKD